MRQIAVNVALEKARTAVIELNKTKGNPLPLDKVDTVVARVISSRFASCLPVVWDEITSDLVQ